MSCNVKFLKTGPCNIAYKGESIGVTLDSPLLNIKPEFYEARYNDIGEKTVSKVITNMKFTIFAEVEISRNFANFFSSKRKINNVVFGNNELTTGGELCLSPLLGDNSICYGFPKAVLIPQSVYACKNGENYYLKMSFEVYEDSDGVLMQKYSIKNSRK